MLMKSPQVQIRCVIACPKCEAVAIEHMPVDACQWFYRCNSCKQLLTPKPGDCCVFCSYGSLPCPPVQVGKPRRKQA